MNGLDLKSKQDMEFFSEELKKTEQRVLNQSKKKCEVLFLPHFCPIMLRLI